MDATKQDWALVRRLTIDGDRTIGSSNTMNLKSSSKKSDNCKKCDCANSITRRKREEHHWTLDSNNDECSSR